MNAHEIKIALAGKHDDDFYITEVKTGPSWGNPVLRIIDAWAMKKSWSRPETTVYEVKTSHSDFVNDSKWPEYLEYGNRFYWACPKGVISKDEIDKQTGLIYVYPSGHCRTVKKAVYRNVDIPPEFFQYVLMNKVDSDRIPFYSSKAEFIRAWIDNKESNKALGLKFNSEMAKRVARLDTAQLDAQRLFAALDKAGWEYSDAPWRWKRRIDGIKDIIGILAGHKISTAEELKIALGENIDGLRRISTILNNARNELDRTDELIMKIIQD